MDSQVEEVKRKTDIAAVIGERVKLTKAGRNFRGLCPFHSEKTPSFFVSPELSIYKCFGCSASGDAIAFLEEFEGMEFGEALEYLAARAGVTLKEWKRNKGEATSKERLVEVNHLAAEFYHYLLVSHKAGSEALAYLKKRGVTQEAMEVFRLGYAPDRWDGVQMFLVGKKGYRVEELDRVGLVIKREQGQGYYDRFRARVMFPLTDARGRVMGFAGRILDPEAKEAKYVNTPETGLYHKRELLYGLSVTRGMIKQADQAVVVEGELDAISSWQAQVKNVVAIKGSAFTEEQIQVLKRYTTQVRLALDADTAGTEATRRSISLADSLGMSVRIVEIEGGKDPDEMAQSQPKKWREAVKQAIGVYDFYVKTAFNRGDIKTGEGKRAVSSELAPILSGMTNQVEQAHYVKLVADRLQVSEEAVWGEVSKAKAGIKAQGGTKVTDAKPEPQGRREKLEEYWLGLVLRLPKEAQSQVMAETTEDQFESMAVGKVVNYLRDWLVKREFKIGEVVKELPAELQELVERVWLQEAVGTEEVEAGAVEAEVKGAEVELKKLRLQDRLKQLERLITQLEQQEDMTAAEVEQLRQAQADFVTASKELGAIV